MLRFLLRFVGFWLVAGGFVALIVDGTRSIAASRMLFTSAGDAWYAIAPHALERTEAAASGAAWLWPRIMVPLLSLPASLLLVLVGLALLGLGRVRERSRFQVS
ncbi:hypothetical protein [Xanthobacter agilis]|uniref:PetM family of cytochrome b6f complex subunit 7 n=1 Tax=Xanthobacter agilis TaxID=47492 RepID=A0ABU0L8J3_XANAG|nr:hypothetical protein [Xanthobacter agilis]MDQ0503425.1 hypothetical protein [Xanthobacter agilis]